MKPVHASLVNLLLVFYFKRIWINSRVWRVSKLQLDRFIEPGLRLVESVPIEIGLTNFESQHRFRGMCASRFYLPQG